MSNESASTRNRQARFFLHEAWEPLPLRQGQYHTHNWKIDSIDTTQSLKDSVSSLHHPQSSPAPPLVCGKNLANSPLFCQRGNRQPPAHLSSCTSPVAEGGFFCCNRGGGELINCGFVSQWRNQWSHSPVPESLSRHPSKPDRLHLARQPRPWTTSGMRR